MIFIYLFFFCGYFYFLLSYIHRIKLHFLWLKIHPSRNVFTCILILIIRIKFQDTSTFLTFWKYALSKSWYILYLSKNNYKCLHTRVHTHTHTHTHVCMSVLLLRNPEGKVWFINWLQFPWCINIRRKARVCDTHSLSLSLSLSWSQQGCQQNACASKGLRKSRKTGVRCGIFEYRSPQPFFFFFFLHWTFFW